MNNHDSSKADLVGALLNSYAKFRIKQECLPRRQKNAQFYIGKVIAYDGRFIRLDPYVDFEDGQGNIKKHIDELKEKYNMLGNSNAPNIPKQISIDTIAEFEEVLKRFIEGDLEDEQPIIPRDYT